jgi:hypothetical protein
MSTATIRIHPDMKLVAELPEDNPLDSPTAKFEVIQVS